MRRWRNPQSTITDYKALICIFLQGGNDSNNLFIPTIPAEWANYATIRTPVLAIPNTDGSGATALALNNLTNDGHTYGIHPACPELQTLFNNGQAGRRLQRRHPGLSCDQGAVHGEFRRAAAATFLPRGPADAVANVHPRCQPPSTGWGGRCADLLDTYNPKNGANDVLSMSVSLAGSNTFEVGGTTHAIFRFQRAGSSRSTPPSGPSAAQSARHGGNINSILGIDAVQQNMLVQNYSPRRLEHALASGTGLTASLASSPLASYWKTFPTTVAVPERRREFHFQPARRR